MAESDRSVHFSDSARLIDSTNLGHPDPVHEVRRFGTINDVHLADAEHHCYQRLSNSMSSTSSSVVPLLHVYRRRWYILFIFTFFSFVQVKTLFQFFSLSACANVITVCVCVCVYIHLVARTNSCKKVVLRGCVRLQGAISYFLVTGSSQMNVEAASDVDPKY